MGLGVKEGVLRKRKELLEKRRLTSEEKRKVEATFRTTVSRKVSQKALGIDVDKAQRSIQFLDEKASVRRHELWPREGNAHMATESSEGMVDRGLYYSDDRHDGGDNYDNCKGVSNYQLSGPCHVPRTRLSGWLSWHG